MWLHLYHPLMLPGEELDNVDDEECYDDDEEGYGSDDEEEVQDDVRVMKCALLLECALLLALELELLGL